MNFEGSIHDYNRCHYKKKSVYKREYYLKKKIISFQEKYDFNFSNEDLKWYCDQKTLLLLLIMQNMPCGLFSMQHGSFELSDSQTRVLHN